MPVAVAVAAFVFGLLGTASSASAVVPASGPPQPAITVHDGGDPFVTFTIPGRIQVGAVRTRLEWSAVTDQPADYVAYTLSDPRVSDPVAADLAYSEQDRQPPGYRFSGVAVLDEHAVHGWGTYRWSIGGEITDPAEYAGSQQFSIQVRAHSLLGLRLTRVRGGADLHGVARVWDPKVDRYVARADTRVAAQLFRADHWEIIANGRTDASGSVDVHVTVIAGLRLRLVDGSTASTWGRFSRSQVS